MNSCDLQLTELLQQELLYYDYADLPPAAKSSITARRVESLEEMLSLCDVVTINCPLHEKTKGLFNKELIGHMKKGSYLVNTARGAICVAEDVKEALESGHLMGYAGESRNGFCTPTFLITLGDSIASGDVWNVQPAPKNHPWRTMHNPLGGGNGMVAHLSGTSLDAQGRS